MTTSTENLKTLLKHPKKTSDVIDCIQKEVKEMSIAVYDDVYKGFKGGSIKERKRLNSIAEARIEVLSFDIRNKYFNSL